MQQITLRIGDLTLQAELNNSPTAAQIGSVLPIEGVGNRWGDEIYFEIPVTMDEALNAQTVVESGALAYWPPGRAFCIFFGATPVSRDGRPQAYSPVNVVGRVLDDTTKLRATQNGVKVWIGRQTA